MKLAKIAKYIIIPISSLCFLVFLSTWIQLKFFKQAIFIAVLKSLDYNTAMFFSSLWLWGLTLDLVTLIMVSIEFHFKGRSTFPAPLGFFCYFLYSIAEPHLLFNTTDYTSVEINSFLKVLEFLFMTIFGSSILFLPNIVLSISEKIGNWFESIGLESIASLISSKKSRVKIQNTNFD